MEEQLTKKIDNSFLGITNQRTRKKSFLFAIALTVLMIGAGIYLYIDTHQPDFIPPEFDELAKNGAPELVDNFDYIKLTDDFSVGLTGTPYIENDELFIFFTNPPENKYWALLLLISPSGSELGRSGVLKPGEYITSIPLKYETEEISVSDVLLKVISYEPETYESRGTVTINPQIYVK